MLPAGALSLLATIVMLVQKDASVALDVARQHGEEILQIRAELVLIKDEVRDRTQLRYTARDAEKDRENLLLRIQVLESRVSSMEKQDDKDHGR